MAIKDRINERHSIIDDNGCKIYGDTNLIKAINDLID